MNIITTLFSNNLQITANNANPLSNLFLFLIGYFLGSIMLSIIISKFFYHKDVRNYFSGNPGATNTGRVLGNKIGVAVSFFDMGKGMIPIGIAIILRANVSYFSESYIYCAGLGAVFGHCFPIFFKFRGGKGAATFGGTILIMNWWLGLLAIFFWLVSNIITKYVSLSTIIISIFVVIISIVPVVGRSYWINNWNKVVYPFNWYYDTLMYLLVCSLIIIKHHSNIERLFDKEESISPIYIAFKKYIIKK